MGEAVKTMIRSLALVPPRTCCATRCFQASTQRLAAKAPVKKAVSQPADAHLRGLCINKDGSDALAIEDDSKYPDWLLAKGSQPEPATLEELKRAEELSFEDCKRMLKLESRRGIKKKNAP